MNQRITITSVYDRSSFFVQANSKIFPDFPLLCRTLHTYKLILFSMINENIVIENQTLEVIEYVQHSIPSKSNLEAMEVRA